MTEEALNRMQVNNEELKVQVWYYETMLTLLRAEMIEAGNTEALPLTELLDEEKTLRGLSEVREMSVAMLETLNQSKNVAKGGWQDMSWLEIREKLTEEYEELMCELSLAQHGYREGLDGVRREAPDVGNVAMMARDKARKELGR